MAVVTIPENPCGKTRKTCSEFDVYHPDLGQGQFKDLHKIQSIAPREADGQKLKECATNMKLLKVPVMKRVDYTGKSICLMIWAANKQYV
jgi:hypothetical protein